MLGNTFVALVWLLQPEAARGTLGAGRPVECGATEGLRAGNAWERAKEPNLRRYCDLLASGTAKLVGRGTTALVEDVPRIADAADALLPGRAPSPVLKGRALLRLGRSDAALAAFDEAKRRDERALDDPVALLAYARASARSGRSEAAIAAFRAALPRTAALSAEERSTASFEAGIAVMASGKAGLDEASAMFRQARREAEDVLLTATVAALALALDRSGQREEARAILGERSRVDTRALVSDPRVAEALRDAGAAHERDAIVATAEIGDAPAKEAWRRYLDGAGGKGPWADHARERLGSSRKASEGKAAARAGSDGGR